MLLIHCQWLYFLQWANRGLSPFHYVQCSSVSCRISYTKINVISDICATLTSREQSLHCLVASAWALLVFFLTSLDTLFRTFQNYIETFQNYIKDQDGPSSSIRNFIKNTSKFWTAADLFLSSLELAMDQIGPSSSDHQNSCSPNSDHMILAHALRMQLSNLWIWYRNWRQ